MALYIQDITKRLLQSIQLQQKLTSFCDPKVSTLKSRRKSLPNNDGIGIKL